MNVEYIVVQAGGKGTRMKQMTYNKPKALVPINNLPMIFYLFRHFSEKKFIIIGDYKYEVLKQYLNDLHSDGRFDYEILEETIKCFDS